MKKCVLNAWGSFQDFLWSCRLFLRWMKKSFQYSVFLWNDFDFDYTYLLKLIQFKLQRMILHMESARCEGDAKRLSKMREVDALMDRYFNHDFAEESRKEHGEKWGKASNEFVPIEGSKYFEWKWYYEKAFTEEEQRQAHDEMCTYFKISEEEKAKCLKKIFDEIRDNIKYWWG